MAVFFALGATGGMMSLIMQVCSGERAWENALFLWGCMLLYRASSLTLAAALFRRVAPSPSP